MPKDFFTILRTTNKLNELLANGKINKITQPNDNELVFYVYNKKNYKLLVNISGDNYRVGLTNLEKPCPLTALNFLMLLRKHLLNSTILNIKTLNNDRIVLITFENKNDFKEVYNRQLVVELMGKFSNTFLLSENIILGNQKQAPQELDFKRITLTGAKYVLPTASDKIPFLEQDKIKILFDNSFKNGLEENFDMAEFLFSNINGFSYQTAKIIESLINAKTFDSSAILFEKYINAINVPSSPNISFDGKNYDFYPIDNNIYIDKKYLENFLIGQQEFYDNKELLKDLTTKKNALLSKISSYKKKENKKLALLVDRILEAENCEELRLYGELITSNIYKLKRGLKSFTAVNYYTENLEEITILLDEKLSPAENAQKYFKKYAKHKNSLKVSYEFKKQTEEELNYVLEVESEINNASTLLELVDIENELILGDYIKTTNKTKKEKIKSSKPLEFLIDGFKVLVGKNNLQNDNLTFSSDRLDLWLHAKNYHSAHVIIKTNGKEVPINVILTSAEICAYYSSGKTGDKIPVDYTFKKFVKKPPKAKIGSVIYTDYKTLIVTPNNHEKLKAF